MTGLVKKVVRWYSDPPTEMNVERPMGKHSTKALKQWTRKASATIIYDSTVDEFTAECLFDKVKSKPNITLVGFTTDGVVFGVFFSVAVTKQERDFFDPSIFLFSFESHGRCVTPQRFVVKKEMKKKAFVNFWKSDNDRGFVLIAMFGGSGLYFGNESSKSYCRDLSDSFKGIEDTTLTEKNGTYRDGPFHHYTRLVAVQLE